MPIVEPPASVAPSRIGEPPRVMVVFEPATSGTAVVVTAAFADVGIQVRPIELAAMAIRAIMLQRLIAL